ncbi:MAG TPA: C39 family peptidase [Victivallales bacterium]|nr:C39 family peptidase [Victivallales bacterium]HPO89993.1 C39 family peptidase [Victivallales bacterium]HRR27745.1 C39 family peptidase [Victivallales bacterium]
MKLNIKIFLLGILLFCFQYKNSAVDLTKLDEFIANPDIWNIEASNLVPEKPKNGDCLKWLSDSKDTARYPAYKSPQITFLGEDVIEAIFRFSDGKLSKIDVSLYNRGDVGDISIDVLNNKVEEIGKKIEQWSGDKGVLHEKQRLTTGMWIQKKAWVKGNFISIVMLWSSTDVKKIERGEYLKLEFYKFNPKEDPRKKVIVSSEKDSEIKADISEKELKQNVRKDEKGYIYIDGIPMVDQGEKGYCAVASSEAILRYYGCNVDQHLIAQLACSSADSGTDLNKMYDILKKTGAKFGVKIKDIFSFEFGDFRRKVLKNYNKVEKKEKLPETQFKNWTNIVGYYDQMNLETLRKARVEGEKNDYNKFVKEIISSIDKGIPLLWSLILGMAPESVKLPQLLGGHMRIIKGYNKETNEIVYMDTWGVGHDWKTMKFEDAWAVTMGLYIVEPKKK